MGMLVLFVTAVLVSTTFHYIVYRFSGPRGDTALVTKGLFSLFTHSSTSIAAAVVSAVIFNVLAYIQLGYLDPFFLIALFVSGAIAFGIALVVGIPFLFHRRRRVPGYCPNCRYNLIGNVLSRCPECRKKLNQ